MPLQNRVDPLGDIHAVPAHGTFTGNRGVVHDPMTRTLLKRRWTTKAWLICECDFKGRRRAVMGRNSRRGTAGWTELFFLDEVTALAAGHRPCFHCRRARANAFFDCHASAASTPRPSAGELDARLHAERRASGGTPPMLDASIVAALPDGAMVAAGEKAFALHDGCLRQWSFSGWYGERIEPVRIGTFVMLLTPPATLAALRAGFRPVWHPSIDA